MSPVTAVVLLTLLLGVQPITTDLDGTVYPLTLGIGAVSILLAVVAGTPGQAPAEPGRAARVRTPDTRAA